MTISIGLLPSTSQAVMPARLQFRFLQPKNFLTTKTGMSYQSKLTLNAQCLDEPKLWFENI